MDAVELLVVSPLSAGLRRFLDCEEDDAAAAATLEDEDEEDKEGFNSN